MNPKLVLMIGASSTKRMAVLVVATTMAIVTLPVGAVLALTNTSLLGSAASSTDGYVYNDPTVPGDGYDYGYCTYWAALRRIQIGIPIPNNWGNAITWDFYAKLAGYQVNHIPSFGAIFQWSGAPGGLGHVAFVESVDPASGAWTISEMNAIGWDVVNEKTYPASQAENYNFIHEKAVGIEP